MTYRVSTRVDEDLLLDQYEWLIDHAEDNEEAMGLLHMVEDLIDQVKNKKKLESIAGIHDRKE